MKIIIIRHAETEKDPNTNAVNWSLSSEGFEQAKNLLNYGELDDIEEIYTSGEKKSYLTAKPLADKLGLIIKQSNDLNEIKRGDKYLSDEEFKKEKELQLRNLDYEAYGGETGNEAIKRFNSFIDNLKDEFEGKTVALVSHGTIINLFIKQFTSPESDIMERWRNTGFSSFGIIEDGKLVKDII